MIHNAGPNEYGKRDRFARIAWGIVEQHIATCRKSEATLRVGVVGHRLNRLTDYDTRHLEARIREVLVQLQDSIATGTNSSNGTLAVVTSLAEGADRIVAREAVTHGILETVVLPFPRAQFEQDFPTEESRREFRMLLAAAVSVVEPEGTAVDFMPGYDSASSTIVACADALLAIWDGQPGRGPGGTAHTIERAILQGLPVIWVTSHPPYPVRVVTPSDSTVERHVVKALTQVKLALEGADPPEAKEDQTDTNPPK